VGEEKEREREREKKKRVGNNPSSDSWICEPFADADGTLLVIYFLFFIFFTSISSVAFKPFLLARLHHQFTMLLVEIFASSSVPVVAGA